MQASPLKRLLGDEKRLQFFLFVINGSILGVVSWASQYFLFKFLGSGPMAYTVATVLIYPPLVTLNFFIQRKYIFEVPGRFLRFVLSNLLIMGLVAMLAPIMRWQIGGVLGMEWGNLFGFPVAALLGAIPSFLLKRRWAFELKWKSES